MTFFRISAFLALATAIAAHAQSTTYLSPNNQTETCRAFDPLPGADYSDKDKAQELKLCGADFYSKTIALCPKTSSTSAAIEVFDISALNVTPEDYESTSCNSDKAVKIGKLKPTMIQADTSGTLSISSLLYYHFSRLLGTLVEVPVAVYRSVDKEVMLNRVALHANGQSDKNRAAWAWVVNAAGSNPTYLPLDDILTSDRAQFYGVLLKTHGDRYGAEINSARTAGWGLPQVKELQTTAAFTALRTAQPLANVTAGTKYSAVQMAYWMRELSEIAILDEVFSQQDRVGNIDFYFDWVWYGKGKNGQEKVQSEKADTSGINKNSLTLADAAKVPQPKDLPVDAKELTLIQRTVINDNDAGGTPRFANFAHQSGMVAGLRHLNAAEYVKVQELAKDLASGGPVLASVKAQFGMTVTELAMVVKNAATVAATLKANCKAGLILFDLDEKRFVKALATNAPTSDLADKVDCGE